VLDPQDQRLARLFVAIVLGRWDEVRALRADAPPGQPDRSWREAVRQVHLFAGFPRQVEAYEVLAQAGGLGPLDPDEHAAEPDLPARGRDLFADVYGQNAAAVEARLVEHDPDFGAWIIGHAYGRVLSRPGLSAARRELLAVGALAATGQARQLASHARGAVHCGATPEAVFGVLEATADLIRPERVTAARHVLEKFTKSPKR
jgi:alkylhydroperoxidase/carboxymuconolactone decarboxylase family protein YurZ